MAEIGLSANLASGSKPFGFYNFPGLYAIICVVFYCISPVSLIEMPGVYDFFLFFCLSLLILLNPTRCISLRSLTSEYLTIPTDG